MDEEAQAALVQALLQQLLPEQVGAMQQVVREQLLVAFHSSSASYAKAHSLRK